MAPVSPATLDALTASRPQPRTFEEEDAIEKNAFSSAQASLAMAAGLSLVLSRPER
jgi:hypothetical protein